MRKVYLTKKFDKYSPLIDNGKAYTDKIEIDQLRIHRRFSCLNYIIKDNRILDLNLPKPFKVKKRSRT